MPNVRKTLRNVKRWNNLWQSRDPHVQLWDVQWGRCCFSYRSPRLEEELHGQEARATGSIMKWFMKRNEIGYEMIYESHGSTMLPRMFSTQSVLIDIYRIYFS